MEDLTDNEMAKSHGRYVSLFKLTTAVLSNRVVVTNDSVHSEVFFVLESFVTMELGVTISKLVHRESMIHAFVCCFSSL